MGEQYKLVDNGKCMVCDIVPVPEEVLRCFMCKGVFHCACLKMGGDEKPGTKSLVASVNRPSTKRNFQFFCDSCITECENDLMNSETRRLKVAENNGYYKRRAR